MAFFSLLNTQSPDPVLSLFPPLFLSLEVCSLKLLHCPVFGSECVTNGSTVSVCYLWLVYYLTIKIDAQFGDGDGQLMVSATVSFSIQLINYLSTLQTFSFFLSLFREEEDSFTTGFLFVGLLPLSLGLTPCALSLSSVHLLMIICHITTTTIINNSWRRDLPGQDCLLQFLYLSVFWRRVYSANYC